MPRALSAGNFMLTRWRAHSQISRQISYDHVNQWKRGESENDGRWVLQGWKNDHSHLYYPIHAIIIRSKCITGHQGLVLMRRGSDHCFGNSVSSTRSSAFEVGQAVNLWSLNQGKSLEPVQADALIVDHVIRHSTLDISLGTFIRT